MSETETHAGRLKKVELNTSLEEWCQKKMEEKGITSLPLYCSNYIEAFRDDYPRHEFFIVKNEVWEVVEHEKLDECDINKFTPSSDGYVSFVTQFYNGGTCLEEVIEEGLKKLNK